MADPLETVGLVVGGGAGWKAVEFIVSRFVTRADAKEAMAEREREDRERAVSEKLDRLLAEVGELRSDARTDRERQVALQAAHSEVKSRLDGMSENYGRRIGQLEQDMAALKAKRR